MDRNLTRPSSAPLKSTLSARPSARSGRVVFEQMSSRNWYDLTPDDFEGSSEFGYLKQEKASQWMDFWGDEYAWTNLLPAAWSAIDNPYLHGTVVPQTVYVDHGLHDSGKFWFHRASTWTSVLHLLIVGMGWTNLSAGLKRWSSEGYEQGHHPVLDLIKKMCSNNDLRALQAFLHPWHNVNLIFWINETLGNPRQLRPEFDTDDERGNEDEIAESLRGASPLGRNLLTGDADPLHVVMHVQHWLEKIELSRDAKISRVSDSRHVVIANSYYAGIGALARSELTRLDDPNDHHTEAWAEIVVVGLGSLGTYFGSTGRRWFRVSESYGMGAQFNSHQWGELAQRP